MNPNIQAPGPGGLQAGRSPNIQAWRLGISHARLRRSRQKGFQAESIGMILYQERVTAVKTQAQESAIEDHELFLVLFLVQKRLLY